MFKINEDVIEDLKSLLIQLNQECLEVLPLERSPVKDEINLLFRAFHSLKSNCLYLDLDDLADWAVLIEDTLSKLRNGLTASNEIINWLNSLLDQIDFWQSEIQAGNTTLEFINTFKKEPDWLCEDKEFIYDMSILYIGSNLNIQKILSYKFDKFTTLSELEKIKLFIKSGVDVIILDHQSGLNIIETVDTILDNSKTVRIVVSTQPNDLIHIIPNELIFNPKKEKLGSIYNYIFKAVQSNENIVKRFKRKQNLKIKYIEYLVSNITSMPDSIDKIKKIIQHPRFEMPDLIEAVRNDPIATALVMKASKQPEYGFNKNHKLKLQDIITMLGSKVVYTILVEKMLNKTFKHNLDAYGLKISDFLKLAMKRTNILNRWINQHNYKDLNDLPLMIYFVPIGQYILSEDLLFTSKDDIFRNLIEDGGIQVSQAEKQIVGYSTPQISAIILENWGFDHNIFFPILKMGHFNYNIGTPNIKKSIIILNFIFDKINQLGIDDTISSQFDYEKLFKEFNLDLESLNEIIKKFL